jgi:hypothetical protein
VNLDFAGGILKEKPCGVLQEVLKKGEKLCMAL